MTNTKLRKRALLSSVAMLLVALVALGSATFAWFVANPTATASGLALKTKAEAGVHIASQSLLKINQDAASADKVSWPSVYGSDSILKATGTKVADAVTDATSFTLQPVSPNTAAASFASGALSFGKIAASGSDTKNADTNKTFSAAENGDLYAEKIFMKASTEDTGSSVQVKSASVVINLVENAPAIANGVKVALVTSTGELLGIWKPDVASGADSSVTWNGDTEHTYAASGANATVVSYANYKTSGAYVNFTSPITVTNSVDSTTGQTDYFVYAYVYLDGENTAVFSDNVPSATELVSSIAVSVSTATHS